MEVKVKAYAKINLMLDIINKRTDNYHDLFMIMQSINLYDTVTVSENKTKSISITCNNADIPLDSKNIAWKATEAFFEYTKKKNKGININIIKRIPHAAGLAGGSADGAAVITALNKIYKTDLSDDELCKIGVKVGADLPFCLTGGTLLAQGIGDILNKVKPLRKCHIVLIKPDVDIKTKAAFYLFSYFPNRIEIKEIMKNNNALGVCMSGSGPSIFGIFTDKYDAQKSCEELKNFSDNVFLTAPVSKGCKIIE